MCSMSFTVVVIARSETVMMRFSISSGDRPGYDQIRPTTGMSMYGKISVGMVMNAAVPSTEISTHMTKNVKGRRSATERST